jgi:hypothetical protein
MSNKKQYISVSCPIYVVTIVPIDSLLVVALIQKMISKPIRVTNYLKNAIRNHTLFKTLLSKVVYSWIVDACTVVCMWTVHCTLGG